MQKRTLYISIITAILICLFSIPTFAETAPVNEKENNNVSDRATAIQFSVPTKGELADFSDVDWFSFNITKEGYFSLTFGPDDSAAIEKLGVGWYVYLYDENRSILKHFKSTYKVFANQYISLAKGKYYIRIVPRVENKSLAPNVPYRLLLQFTEDNSWIPDDSGNRAYKKADFGKIYHGTILRKGDRDVLYFKNTAAGKVNVDFEVDPSYSESKINSGWDICVLNKNKKRISDYYCTQYDETNPLSGIKVDGNFYVKIKPHSSKVDNMPISCKYDIKVSFIKDPPKKIEKIKVKKIKVKKIKTNNKSIKIKKGKTKKIKATVLPKNATNKKLTYKSSNKKVATVSKTGKIKAKKKGKCTITITSADDKNVKKKIKIKVTA